jgi:cell division cycle 14
MIIELGFTSKDVWKCFSMLEEKMEMYRDAQATTATFRLKLIDCWGGLERACGLGWVGQYDLDEYLHYSNPLEGDMHAIIPDKLIAFRGPVELDGEEYRDVGGVRFFSPAFYVGPLLDMGVTTVIRLNSEPYDPAPFEAAGMLCLHLDLDGGGVLPPVAVAAFLDAASSAARGDGGAVAVHCREGLGRTGTMAAAQLMAGHGFSAREAMGWLRIVRPGSVVGSQQHFLCRLGEALDCSGDSDNRIRAGRASSSKELGEALGRHASSSSAPTESRVSSTELRRPGEALDLPSKASPRPARDPPPLQPGPPRAGAGAGGPGRRPCEGGGMGTGREDPRARPQSSY